MNSEAIKRIKRFEIPAMNKTFPQFQLSKGDGSFDFIPNGAIFWQGKLMTNFGTAYNVAIVYPENYPHDQIYAYVKELIGVSTPHRYLDGHLCLYSNDHGGGGEGIGRETTAVTITAWTATWLNAYEVYKRTGNWGIKTGR